VSVGCVEFVDMCSPFARSSRVFTQVSPFERYSWDHSTLEECSTPMTAHETCAEAVLLVKEVGGDDERKDVQRDADYVNE